MVCLICYFMSQSTIVVMSGYCLHLMELLTNIPHVMTCASKQPLCKELELLCMEGLIKALSLGKLIHLSMTRWL